MRRVVLSVVIALTLLADVSSAQCCCRCYTQRCVIFRSRVTRIVVQPNPVTPVPDKPGELKPIPRLTYTVFRDVNKEYRWRIRAGNNEIIATSEGYHNRVDCEHSLDLIKLGAATMTERK